MEDERDSLARAPSPGLTGLPRAVVAPRKEQKDQLSPPLPISAAPDVASPSAPPRSLAALCQVAPTCPCNQATNTAATKWKTPGQEHG